MATDVWNPDLYARFGAERAQPFHDLLALVRARPGMRVVDLGCGPGELTAHLHRSLAARETLGLDASAAMLARAAAHAGGGLSFVEGDIGAFAGEGFDLVFSNAALHWIPDHGPLLARLAGALAPGGQLAVQVPANHDHVSHRLAHEIAREPPFAGALGGYERGKPVLEPEEYAHLLFRLGFREQHVRLVVYAHPMPARDDVVDWVRGTLLTDFQKRLPQELWDRFLATYRARLVAALPDDRPFLYTYKRILFWGVR
ncbi:MAG TPA: methyltransferase domain-containing protein [Anaeromyxobacteraceae bacterium]|nr:methyltransferase domain-containing protein [Anaeromyxobacteraceae bacterium]